MTFFARDCLSKNVLEWETINFPSCFLNWGKFLSVYLWTKIDNKRVFPIRLQHCLTMFFLVLFCSKKENNIQAKKGERYKMGYRNMRYFRIYFATKGLDSHSTRIYNFSTDSSVQILVVFGHFRIASAFLMRAGHESFFWLFFYSLMAFPEFV
jgi:hypothetical protein